MRQVGRAADQAARGGANQERPLNQVHPLLYADSGAEGSAGDAVAAPCHAAIMPPVSTCKTPAAEEIAACPATSTSPSPTAPAAGAPVPGRRGSRRWATPALCAWAT